MVDSQLNNHDGGGICDTAADSLSDELSEDE